MYGAPPAGLTLPSGLVFVSPNPNPPNRGFIIGDYKFNAGFGGYGLGTNGFISSPADLHSGTAFAASESGTALTSTITFRFPFPVDKVGAFVSSLNAVPITLSIFDSNGLLIESDTFPSTLPVPLTDKSFLGVGSSTPIESFSIGVPPSGGSIGFYVFDDVTFEAAPPVPEPSSLALLALGGVALAGWRRWRKRAAA
jgi:hypothetical protein